MMIFILLSSLKRGMVLVLNYGMIHGVRGSLWKISSQNLTILLVTRMLQWLSCCCPQRQTTIGISDILDWFKIGSWSRLYNLWTLFILDLGEGMGWVKFVGNSQLGVFLMFILIIGPYNPKIQILFHGNQKCLQRLVSLFGQRLWGKFNHW